MAMPKILDWLDDFLARIATNETNIAQNAADITTNKGIFDTHAANDTRHWTTTDRQNFDRVVHFKGYYTTEAKLKEAYPTGQVGDYAIVGETDTVWAWDDETKKWLNSTKQGVVITVNGRTGEVMLTKTDVGLSNADNTSDIDKPVSTAQQTALNSKADRRQVSKTEIDSTTLRSGTYYVKENTTILGFSSQDWTVIVGEQNPAAKLIYGDINGDGVVNQADVDLLYSFINETATPTATQKIVADVNLDGKINGKDYTLLNNYVNNGAASDIIGTIVPVNEGIKSATQIWIPYTDGAATKMFIRHQKSGTSWENFVEILTSTHLATLNTTISGIDSRVTTNTTNIATNTSNIATNASNIAANKTAADKAIKKNSDDIATNATNIAKNTTDIATNKANIATNTSNIATNTSNIATNASNISKNTTSINTLSSNKADRKDATIAQLDGMTLRAGMYRVNNSSKTILGYTAYYWDVIVGEQNSTGSASATQIWMPFSTDENIKGKLFFRRQKYDSSTSKNSWEDFIEILTTEKITEIDITHIKQYKGYYADLLTLKAAYPTATSGDYAVVDNAIYIWVAKNNNWAAISGGGGGGAGKWSIKQYDAPNAGTIPYLKYVVGLSLDKQWTIDDTVTLLDQSSVDKKIFLFETWINMNSAQTWSQTFSHDDGVVIYLNGIVVKTNSGSVSNDEFSLSLKQGWNKLVIALKEATGSEKLVLTSKITDEAECLGIDCYHSENDLIEGYVPLVGSSTIEGNTTISGTLTTTGNFTSGGTVGVTSNAYLQYNSEDKSISFIFN